MGEDSTKSLSNVIQIEAWRMRPIEGAKEDKAGWSSFPNHLKERGLSGVKLVILDACLGLVESVAEVYPQARWRRRVMHWHRNAFSHVPSTKVREVALMPKAIHA